MRVKWLRTATRDLDAEITTLALEDAALAHKVYTVLRERAMMLQHFPESGRKGKVFGTRELVIVRYPYIIPYRIRDGVVEILRIFHTSRKTPHAW